MPQNQIPELAKKFFESYDPSAKDEVWKQQSNSFRKFWKERVLNQNTAVPTDDECDAVIRILDRNGKGNTKDTEAIAKVMVPQGAWRKMFAVFRSNAPLANQMNGIFEESDAVRQAGLIDQFYSMNEGKKNYLTGESGNALNAFMAAYDPFKNLSVISLNDRKTLLEFLGLEVSFDWDKASTGRQIVESNRILITALNVAGIRGTARTVSRFCYWDPFKEQWKQEHTAKRDDKVVTVTVPTNSETEESEGSTEEKGDEIRESFQIQALLAEIGSRMGLRIWLPRSDRGRVLTKWKAADGDLLETLPLHYDPSTMSTIEQIDVIWLKKRSIVRAFEVEHTTSVYSGLLRMADLVALQPNMDIKLHIVAHASKREKVFQEIRRPVFSLLEGHPLSEICTYLTYESVRELAEAKYLDRMSDSVIEDFAEKAET